MGPGDARSITPASFRTPRPSPTVRPIGQLRDALACVLPHRSSTLCSSSDVNCTVLGNTGASQTPRTKVYLIDQHVPLFSFKPRPSKVPCKSNLIVLSDATHCTPPLGTRDPDTYLYGIPLYCRAVVYSSA